MLHFMRRGLWILIFLPVLMMNSCNDKNDIYDRPDWLKGNAWEVLSSRSDVTLFLKAIERSGFKDLVNGKGIVTVLAPTDDALKKYLEEKGYASIDVMPLQEVKKFVGFHLVYYSFNKEQFANYQPDGVANASTASYGLYFKHRTKSRDSIETVYDYGDDKYRKVIHKERFIPVFSSYLFNTKDIDAKYNYEYFYPSSTWSGDNGGFNVSNASVTEYNITTDNGYVYILDKVAEPLETVHTELKKEANYSEFISMYDRFATFWYDASATAQYATSGDSLYIMQHLELPQIASEWSYNGENTLPDYADLATLSSKAFNVFAPSNEALHTFFDQFWKDSYPANATLSDVGYLPIAFLLYNHVYQGSLVFPDEVKKGIIKSSFGNVIQFDPATDVSSRKICSNGAIYGLNKVIVPNMFTSITAPLFKKPSYKIFLYMMAYTGMIQPLMSDAIQNTIFIPSDDVILNTLYGDSYIFWSEGNPRKYGDEMVQVENTEGVKVAMSNKAMRLFVYNHIATTKVTEISGTKVYRTRNPFSYLFVTDAGVASTSSYNASVFYHATEIPGNWTNGKDYDIEASLLSEQAVLKAQLISATTATSTLNDYSEFSKLLSSAGLLTAGSELSFLLGDNYLIFAPSNSAILDAKSKSLIPTVTADLLTYVKKYIVPVSPNSLTDYPFIGSGIQGDLFTSQVIGRQTTKITLTDNGAYLQVSLGASTAKITNVFPRVYSDGAIYSIDSVL
jgi:uncharacterized surface protein with fasciclin (FAS1) repeats